MKITQLSTLFFSCLLGILPAAASAQPFVISKDGTEVTDQKTGLIWRRCAEGMSWNGKTCTGTASIFTHVAALQMAAAQATSTGVAWRLPNIDELSSIIDRSRTNPAINLKNFPATPAGMFWTSSPEVGNHEYGWYVNFKDGFVHMDFDRGLSYHARLVRTGQ